MLGSRQSDQQQGEKQDRDRNQRLNDAHYDSVEQTATIPAHQADEASKDECQHRPGERERDDQPAATDRPAEHITPKLVEAEKG